MAFKLSRKRPNKKRATKADVSTKVRPLSVRTGDFVQIITGEDKGRTGKIVKVDTEAQRVFVEGCKMQKRHMKARKANEASRIDERPGPIHVSNVRKVDAPSTPE